MFDILFLREIANRYNKVPIKVGAFFCCIEIT